MTVKLQHPDAAHALRARMWQSAHPDAVARVAELLGSDTELAAHMLAGHDGTADSLCAELETTLTRLVGEIMDDAKARVPAQLRRRRAR